jgi:L-threonylcarbamoyladenylate synthase
VGIQRSLDLAPERRKKSYNVPPAEPIPHLTASRIVFVPPSPSPSEIQHAATLLRAGRLVAFPTETVYGLGANALDADAVARIYAAKGRPATSPLIVHVASIEMAKSLAAEWPAAADLLTKQFWPGPLTLVLRKKPAIPGIVTAGLDTVGLRMPSHPVAQALLEAAGIPLAAPSANRFTEVSPTTAEHVRQSLGNNVDLILDGGPCTVGIESTVLSLIGPQPVLLRPGGISRAQIESIIGSIAIAQEAPSGPHPSPGMHARHYSPRTSLLLVSDGKLPEAGKGIYLEYSRPPIRSAHSAIRSDATTPRVQIIQMPADPAAYAAILYEKLHQADAAHVDWIAVEKPPATSDWEAVNDRLRRAATRERNTGAT